MIIKIVMIVCLVLVLIGLLMLLWCDHELKKIAENLRRLRHRGRISNQISRNNFSLAIT